ncbi:MAG: glycine cleavage system aminomethyltransferase GcvT [Xanthomonadaceae bacterium]|nr:glycine cleavage system aminomethyltransferase GcvT [Xanthomonadaceae bacterium]
MARTTPLYQAHLDQGARMVEFAGWSLPIRYGSLVEEHHSVRRAAGMFDVSHMTVVDIRGADARAALRYLLANDVDRIREPGQAIYGCMLDPRGGILDDLITYRIEDDFYRLVVNAATRESDLEWIGRQLVDYDLSIRERDDLAMIAVQGPDAIGHVIDVLDVPDLSGLKPFRSLGHDDLFIARTGYTGEDGCEIILPNALADPTWRALADRGVVACGLGARDSLRLEAGLNLYGQDMDRETTPLESNLSWTVAFEPEQRDFIGRAALEQQNSDGVGHKLIGLLLESGGIPRSGAAVTTEHGAGRVTSGGFSPTLECPIAIARIPLEAEGSLEVELRGKKLAARVVKLPFVRNGQPRKGLMNA